MIRSMAKVATSIALNQQVITRAFQSCKNQNLWLKFVYRIKLLVS